MTIDPRHTLENEHCRELTTAEREVVVLLTEGLTVVEVACRRVVEESTVRSHIKHVHQKLGTHRLAQIVRFGFRHRECCLGGERPGWEF
ncbi:MAG: helix-turn-helix transcriptional regulator [Chloroflexi bacterium]|jgi:DNA-binding NarL/FixJ family response regulator|nr:helix-turn-helix transcriptional regulator [Dehalococcoidia bacterium]MCO5200827.1 helix-turn-helix transcriptional regulator [Chloroflexota bacterium]MCZ7578679.1 helix-turn-helix transcriptional regulator [Dehalococcoidia bacterium]